MARKKKTTIEAEDLYNLKIPGGSMISPEGEHVAYALQHVDMKTEKKYSNIWIAPASRGKPRQFTFGDHNDHTPIWSPDGKHIAFLSNRKDPKQFQLYVIPIDGGEARPLTDLKGTISSFKWSTDSSRLVMSFRKKDKDEIERESDKKKKELGEVYRHYDKIYFKFDGAGFLPKEHFHLYTVDVTRGRTEQVTDGEHDETDPSWSPDGNSIVFLSNRSMDPGLERYKIDIYMLDLKTRSERRLDLPDGDKMFPRISPDGKWISYSGKLEPGKWWKQRDLFIVRSDGFQPPRNLTKSTDKTLDNLTLNDVQGHPPTIAPAWDPNSSILYFQTTEEGRTKLAYVDIDEEENPFHYLVDEDAVVSEFSFNADVTRFALNRMDHYDPGNIWLLDMEKEGWKNLTDHNPLISRTASEFKIEEHWIEGKGAKIQGWIVHPPGFDNGKSYPSILEIHGGPRAQYGFGFMHEFFYLASKGYIVHFCNPRGSQGYGEDFAGSIWKRWGTVDYDDVISWSEMVSELDHVDKANMCVTGGSYGGYMTNLIIGRNDGFKAAVTQRSVSNLISMWGSSDMNWIFQEEFAEVPPWEDLERYWEQSPMKFIKDAKTPTLVIHSENDLRCSMEQGEQVYVALKKLGVDTELLRFPDEPHALSRMGRTDRRIVRLQHILKWFDRYVGR